MRHTYTSYSNNFVCLLGGEYPVDESSEKLGAKMAGSRSMSSGMQDRLNLRVAPPSLTDFDGKCFFPLITDILAHNIVVYYEVLESSN